MRGRAFRRVATAGVLAVGVFAIAAGWALAAEGPHIKIATPRTSERGRTLIVSGATTSQFPDVRVYLESPPPNRGDCAATFADRPRHVQIWGWNDVVPSHAVGLHSFERNEERAIPVGDTGKLYLLCGYLVDRAGHVGARTHIKYRDPATR
jgi:hypothetical protein